MKEIKNVDDRFDEGRDRVAIQNIRVRAKVQNLNDEMIAKYGKKENVDAIVNLTFNETKMFDIDVKPSFSPGAKSYYQRIVEGRMLDFVVKRLSDIPESKKAVIVFPTYEDYAAVLAQPKDDYLPCLVSVQFRLIPESEGYILESTFYARSMDIYQKGYGNFVSMVMLSDYVAKKLSENLKTSIRLGMLDGLIADVHIYEELIEEARVTLENIKNNGDLEE
jgi:thymidylate synthase